MGHRFHRRTQFNRLVILSSCRKFSHRGHRDNHCLSCNPVEDLATACPGRSRTGKSTNCHKEIVNHKLVLSAVEWIINRNGPSHEFHHFLNCTFAANDHFAGAGKVIIGSIARLFTEGNRRQQLPYNCALFNVCMVTADDIREVAHPTLYTTCHRVSWLRVTK